jgi:hypothetical protein
MPLQGRRQALVEERAQAAAPHRLNAASDEWSGIL